AAFKEFFQVFEVGIAAPTPSSAAALAAANSAFAKNEDIEVLAERGGSKIAVVDDLEREVEALQKPARPPRRHGAAGLGIPETHPDLLECHRFLARGGDGTCEGCSQLPGEALHYRHRVCLGSDEKLARGMGDSLNVARLLQALYFLAILEH